MSPFANFYFGGIDYSLGGKSPSAKKMNKIMNWESAWNFAVLLMNRYLASYSVEELPSSCSRRVAQLSLMTNCNFTFFDDPMGGYLCLPGIPNGSWNVNGDSGEANVFGAGGYNKSVVLHVPGEDDAPILQKFYQWVSRLGKPDGVMIWENEMRVPVMLQIAMYASALADTWRKLETARRNAAVPFVVVTDQNSLNSVKEAFQRRDDNFEYIPISSGIMDPSRVQIYPISTTAEAMKAFTDIFDWYIMKFDSNICGYDTNSNPDKKERLLDFESKSANQASNAVLQRKLDYMNEQIDELINKRYGLNVKVVQGKEDPDEADIMAGLDQDAAGGELGGSAGSSDNGGN